MINIPTTLCKCDEAKSTTPLLYELAPLETCVTECEEITATELVPIVSTLCPCPVTEVVINYNPKPKRIKTIKTCFGDFIKNITSTKYCDNGPTCKTL